MKKIRAALLLVSLAAAYVGVQTASVLSQSGIIPPGFVLGNGSGSPSAIASYGLSAVLDQCCGNTNGFGLFRGGTFWGGRLLVGADLPTPSSIARGGVLSTDYRNVLTANTTYFVRTDGSDSSTCTVDAAGQACLTINGAIAKATAVDANGFTITIQVRTGSYGAVTLRNLVGYTSTTAPVIIGDTATPGNVIIAAPASTLAVVVNNLTTPWAMRGFRTTVTTAGFSHIAMTGGKLTLQNWEFGAATGAGNHITIGSGANLTITGNYTILGGANAHYQLLGASQAANIGATVTLTGTPAWGTAFAVVNQQSLLGLNASTYSGAATGTRWLTNTNGLIDGTGGCNAVLPGNANGAAATQGQCL